MVDVRGRREASVPAMTEYDALIPIVSYWYWEEDLEEEEQRIQKEEGKK